ncbi:NAD-dependent epimerase/dehydratase family protein [Kitasatospora mediocidica]|uniref:NAD-dependent epimerase/dehydratase family protein n=1 Tax=Kitasatospora mediocidica TaxID=58352 RepID=UPI0006905B9D|nr:NAD-dependent epimerase/dehydratase family protein [Kitasatospora mediocidica]
MARLHATDGVTPTTGVTGVTIAVTGASGFCGGEVARAAAARGAEVLCVGRRPGPVGRHLSWDAATEPPDLGGADLVVHCAAAVGDHPPGSPAEAEQYAVNVAGTARLLAAAAGRPVVWVSSASVYDPRLDRSRVAEEHPSAGGQLNAYGRSKAAGERLALAAGAVVLRPRAVYGTGDPHLLPRVLARVRRGLLLLPGADVSLSLTAVQNLADACLAAAGWPPGAYNIADAEPYRRDEVLRRLLAAHGVRARIGHVPLPLVRLARRRSPELTPYAVDQLASSVVLDTAKARAQGWRPTHDLADYLARCR